MGPSVSSSEVSGGSAVVLTLGKFDGVHLGHRHLVARVLTEATARGAAGGALILYPDPATVLTGRPVPLLTSPDERVTRLIALGLVFAELLEFTPALAQLTPEAFVDQLCARWTIAAIVVGPDFAFGRDRSGNVAVLRQLGAERGFELVVVPPVELDGRRVSSGAIRALIAAGEVQAASRLMAAPPRLVGTVVHGAARGRTLGFPTANLRLAADFIVPANGIYTVRASWGPNPGSKSVPEETGGRPAEPEGWPPVPDHLCSADGIASVGVRPTFDNGARIVEVFLLDFGWDLYDRPMTVDFLCRQRSEQKFDSVPELVEQMHRDVAVARANLARMDVEADCSETAQSGE